MQSRPAQKPAAEADPGERPEHQRRQRRVAGDVRGPAVRAVDVAAEGDVVAEGPQELRRVGDPGQVVEVLVRVGQDGGPALGEPVDHDQRHHPGQREQPAGEQQVTPAQPRRAPLQEQPEQQAEHGQRGADPGVRVPEGEQRGIGQDDRHAARVEALTDQHREPDEHQRGGHGDQRRPPPARGREVGQRVLHAVRLSHGPAFGRSGDERSCADSSPTTLYFSRADHVGSTDAPGRHPRKADPDAPPPPERTMSVTVVLPCLDEASALPGVLAAVPGGLAGAGRGQRLDRREPRARRAPRRPGGPRGRVAATGRPCTPGIEAATTEIVAVIDCDGSLDPAELVGPAALVASGQADLVVGRRRVVQSRSWPWHARAGNAVLAGLIRASTGVAVHDIAPVRVGRRRDCSTSASWTAASATRWRRCSPRPRPAGAWSRSTSPTGGARWAGCPR